MADVEFAPSFVKCAISIKRGAFLNWLQERDGEWVNLQIKESRSGNWYASVDNWKPDKTRATDDGFYDDDIPGF